MNRRRFGLAFFGLPAAALTRAGQGPPPAPEDEEPPEPRPEALPEDVETVDGIVTALYDVVSGPKGGPRDWNRFRSLFHSNARLLAVIGHRDNKAAIRALTAEEFQDTAGPAFERDGFYEQEIARKTDRFGHMAQLLSTYEARRSKDEDPFIRGINGIQLFFDGKRWWVLTLYWDAEREDMPIPDEYLPER